MFLSNQPITKYAALNRMLTKRNVTYQEIRSLQEEMDTLKAVICSKQKRLREMNRRIHLHQQRFSQIRLVFTQPAWCVKSNTHASDQTQKQMQIMTSLQCFSGKKQ